MERLTYFFRSPNIFPSSLILTHPLLNSRAKLITYSSCNVQRLCIIVTVSFLTQNMTLIKAKRWHTCWSIATIWRRHAVTVMFDGDFTLNFNPLAGIASSIERFNRSRADKELWVLFTRCICNEPLHAAEWKTIRLRYRIIIYVGNRSKDVDWSFHIDSIIFIFFWLIGMMMREYGLVKFNLTHRCDSPLYAELDQPGFQTPSRICWIYKCSAGIQP